MPSLLSKPWEVYEMIRNASFTKSGDDVDWTVIVDEQYQHVWLVFEESTTDCDWKNNLKFPVKLYKNQESCIRAASGWGDAWKSCNDLIMETFIAEVKKHPNFTPAICGWSYGGAISLLAAEDFYFRTKKKVSVITFGAPKPLWGKKTQEYVRSCCSYVAQWAHVNDCVPAMPPLPGYKRLVTDPCGDKFNIFKRLFKADIYHCLYGDEHIYGGQNG